MDEGTYPKGPDRVPPDLTRPTRAYRRHAYLAVAGLLLFVALYFALTAWFAWITYRLIAAVIRTPDHWPLLFIAAAPGFLAVFMAKALIFIRRGKPDTDLELTAADHPRLFAFLYRLADEAHAPRPHRVFASPGVNAGVYYDFSLVNLIISSRKNLQIGLGLVNVLTLGELKAVLAHEFGHFAQNTMAIGRWIYMAQQIAGHLVTKRDALDRGLHSLSYADIRIAWAGWLMRVIVWSIRSLVDTLFSWVVLAQRALLREMELQADLVAVSLTGSDALVHALHRLDAADDAMDRAMGFASDDRERGKAVADMFTLQTHMLERTRVILGDPTYGVVPALPATPEHHRLFGAQFAQPPRMWSTHPPNDVREANAKRVYIPAPLDDRSGWLLFETPDALRAKVTAGLYADATEKAISDDKDKPKPLERRPIEDTLAALETEFGKRYLDPRYHGIYLGRSIVRAAARVDEIYGDEPAPGAIAAALDALYPAELAEQLARMRELSKEHAMLRALQRGILEAPGRVVRHRGQEYRRRELPRLIEQIGRELTEVREALASHDRRVRTVHLAAVRIVSPAWEAYLRGVLAIHHYADHRRADLDDAAGALQNVFAVVTADGRVSSDERERLIAAANVVYTVLHDIHDQAGRVELGGLASKLDVAVWKDVLEPLRLPRANEGNLGPWLEAVGSWIGDATRALSVLVRVSLDELIRTEEEIARRVRTAAAGDPSAPVAQAGDAGAPLAEAGDAPAPPRPPDRYAVLLPGSERPRQLRLGWWDRFQVADGIVATAARFVVAAAILGGVVLAGRYHVSSTVFVVNGLARPVVVAIGEQSRRVGPGGHVDLDVPSGDYAVRATAEDGRPIEQLTATVEGERDHYLFNVAGAALIAELRAGYPGRRYLAGKHWQEAGADEMFDAGRYLPPRERGTRVLVQAAVDHPWHVPDELDDDAKRAIALAHARWDPPGTKHLGAWLRPGRTGAELAELIRARLERDPEDVAALLAEQDIGPHAEVCARHRDRAAAAPSNPTRQYLAMRCIEDGSAQNQMSLQLVERWPDNGWVLLGAGRAALDSGDYHRAVRWFEGALTRLPEVADTAADYLLRARRLDERKPLSARSVPSTSPLLQTVAAVEATPDQQTVPAAAALHRLYQGEVAAAVASGALNNPSLLMLAAASDGAPDDVIAKGLALPPARLGAALALYGHALALRTGGDAAPYRAYVTAELKGEARPITAFFEALARDPRAAEAAIAGVGFSLRMYTLAAGCVALGAKAPAGWRELVKLALFETERPYFQ